MSEDSKAPWLSIIVPVLNEANGIQQCLAHLQPWREAGCELVVVDGGSVDQSAALAQRYTAEAPPRAFKASPVTRQMRQSGITVAPICS